MKNITDETDVKFYKTYVNDRGKISYFNLSDYHQQGFLDRENANGIIYKSGAISTNSLNQLKTIGIRVSANQSYP